MPNGKVGTRFQFPLVDPSAAGGDGGEHEQGEWADPGAAAEGERVGEHIAAG